MGVELCLSGTALSTCLGSVPSIAKEKKSDMKTRVSLIACNKARISYRVEGRLDLDTGPNPVISTLGS